MNPPVTYHQVKHGSPQYGFMLTFRNAHLREPLGLRLVDAELEGEDKQLHFAALDSEERVVGTVLMKPASETEIKLRQMAVAPTMRGGGIGAGLVKFAENFVTAHGYTRISMTARSMAQGFYEKLGYHREGEEFIDPFIHVPTIIMTKTLG